MTALIKEGRGDRLDTARGCDNPGIILPQDISHPAYPPVVLLAIIA